MALGASFERVAALFEGDIKRMVERYDARIADHDRCEVDAERGSVAFYQRSSLLWRAETEQIATLATGSIKAATGGLLRWVWGDKAPTGSRRVDAAYREAQHYGIEVIASNAQHLANAEARRVVLLAAHLARADGVREIETGREVSFVALFSTGEGERQTARSLAPVPPSTRTLAAAPTGSGTAPGGRASTMPRIATPVSVPPATPRTSLGPAAASLAPAPNISHTPGPGVPSIPASALGFHSADTGAAPSRKTVHALAATALSQCNETCPGFREAVLIVNLEVQGDKARLAAQLVALSPTGKLEVVDTSRAVIDAVGQMVGAARQNGELGWRRLVIRIAPKATGVGFDFAVETVGQARR